MIEPFHFPESLQGYRVHLVGIKGTGMAALAEILSTRGARITGTDTKEKFYTDAVLQRIKRLNDETKLGVVSNIHPS